MSVPKVQVHYSITIPENTPETKTLVPVGNNAIAPSSGSSLCCYWGESRENKRKAIVIFDNFLKQEYGVLTTKRILTRCNFDLSNAQAEAQPLTVYKASLVLGQALIIEEQTPAMKTVIKNMFYYQKLQEEQEEIIPGDKGESPVYNLRHSGKLLVQTRNGKIVSFDAKETQNELEGLTLEKPLTSNETALFLVNVKDELHNKTKQMVQLAPDTIREAIVTVMRRKNILVKRPSLLDIAKENPALKRLSQRVRIEDLKQDEFDLVFDHVSKKEQQSASQSYNLKDEQ